MNKLFGQVLLVLGLSSALAAVPPPGIRFEPYSGELAYGLAVTPPWNAGGRLLISFPEHLDALDEDAGNIKILHYYETQKLNRWQVAPDGLSAMLDVESPFTPGLRVHAKGQVVGHDRIEFVFTINNRSSRPLRWIDPLFCHQYAGLPGFPQRAPQAPAAFSNFEHVYTVVDGRVLRVSTVSTKQAQSRVRGAEVTGSPQPANPFAENHGGSLPFGVDAAISAITSLDEKRKLILSWSPGKTFLSNAEIPCVHADPFFGKVEPGQSVTARGVLILTEGALQPAMLELLKQGHGRTLRSPTARR